jgi:UDP-glucose 4-epimerase
MDQSVLITGINGFIGKHTADAFLRAGFAVSGTDLSPECAVPGIPYVSCDLTDEARVGERLRELRFSCVVHLAAVLAMNSPNTLRINTTAAYHMLRLAREMGCGCFLHLSSVPVIGMPPAEGMITESTPVRPGTAYHVSKYAAEQLVMLPEFSGMRRFNLRIPSPIGPGMPRSFLRLMMERALKGEPLMVYGAGTRVQDYLDARDIAGALADVALTQPEDGLYLLGGETISNLDAVRLCAEIAGGKSGIVMSGQPDPADGERWLVDTSRARAAFGFSPRYGLRRSLEDLAEEMRCGS